MHNYYYCHYQITGILMSEYQVHAETANIGLGTPVQLNAMYEEAAHNRKRELASWSSLASFTPDSKVRFPRSPPIFQAQASTGPLPPRRMDEWPDRDAALRANGGRVPASGSPNRTCVISVGVKRSESVGWNRFPFYGRPNRFDVSSSSGSGS